MNLLHVVPDVSQEAAGPSYSVPRLCQALAALGNEVELACVAARGPIEGVTVAVYPAWRFPRRFAVSIALARSLRHQSRQVDVVHNHSLWSMVNFAAGWVASSQRALLVTSPHGTLSPWALDRRKSAKRLLWPLQARVLRGAGLLHATSIFEYRDIRRLGLTAPVVILPIGIDLPPLSTSSQANGGPRTLLFLGRIHPVKGLDRLLSAWGRLQRSQPEWQLVIAGHGEAAHERDIRALAASLQLQRVTFPGPLYGNAKSAVFNAADLFVLPTHSENFGVAVAEALAHSCPAVVGHGAPWPGLETENCGWWVDNDVDSLTGSLQAAMSLSSDQLVEKGRNGRAWMERDFRWESVAQRTQAAYQWRINGGALPAEVRLD